MATKTSVRPALTDAQLAEMMDLLRGSDAVELKLTVPASQQRAAIGALGLDALDARRGRPERPAAQRVRRRGRRHTW